MFNEIYIPPDRGVKLKMKISFTVPDTMEITWTPPEPETTTGYGIKTRDILVTVNSDHAIVNVGEKNTIDLRRLIKSISIAQGIMNTKIYAKGVEKRGCSVWLSSSLLTVSAYNIDECEIVEDDTPIIIGNVFKFVIALAVGKDTKEFKRILMVNIVKSSRKLVVSPIMNVILPVDPPPFKVEVNLHETSQELVDIVATVIENLVAQLMLLALKKL